MRFLFLGRLSVTVVGKYSDIVTSKEHLKNPLHNGNGKNLIYINIVTDFKGLSLNLNDNTTLSYNCF